MMSLESIVALGEEQARLAKARKVQPQQMLLPEFHQKPIEGQIEEIAGIPNIGTYRPPGFYVDRMVLVDKSGFGREDELALTLPALCEWVRMGDYLAIVEESQFQVVVAAFKRGRKPKGHEIECGRGIYAGCH